MGGDGPVEQVPAFQIEGEPLEILSDQGAGYIVILDQAVKGLDVSFVGSVEREGPPVSGATGDLGEQFPVIGILPGFRFRMPLLPLLVIDLETGREEASVPAQLHPLGEQMAVVSVEPGE